MNRVLTAVAATLVFVAGMAAETVPNHQQPQKKAIPKVVNGERSSKASKPGKVEPKPYQVGEASWYGKQFHGRTTASGEDFDMFELTAAHRQLPLGTYVKVTNLRNGKWIIVRVNDRGPYVGNRIMDLSYSAARMLNFHGGIEKVRLDLIKPETVAVNRGPAGE